MLIIWQACKTYKVPITVHQIGEATYEVMISAPGDRRRVVRAMATVQAASADEALWAALGMVKEADQVGGGRQEITP